MPPLPNVPQVLKVAVTGTYTSSYNWANIFHFSYTGSAPTIADCEAIATAIYSAYNTNFGGDIPPSQTIEEVNVTDLTSSTSAQGGFIESTAGTSTADKLPGNVATLISKTPLARYRGGHPRTYLPTGTDENLQDQGHWNSAYVTHINTKYVDFVNAVQAITSGGTAINKEVCVSYYETDYSTVPPTRIRRAVAVVYQLDESSYIAQPELASQRRRIGRRK